jgi:uncharacterized protein (TIGR00730 family)
MSIKSLTIFCSSSNDLDAEFYEIATELGVYLAYKSIQIIYGGGNSGIMGKISKSSHDNGGNVIGIIPKFLLNEEKAKLDYCKTIVVENMTERKKKLFELGDAFLILPGGPGTIEEATEIISWKFLDLHQKEIIIYNHKGYWNNLFNIYNDSKKNKFSKKNLQSICKYVKSVEEFKKLSL